MFEKVKSLCKRGYFAIAVGLPVAMMSVVALAEETGGTGSGTSSGVTPEIPSALNGLNLTTVISNLADKIGPLLGAALGVAIGIWAILLIWRKVRSTMY